MTYVAFRSESETAYARLTLAADSLSDLESARIAFANRYRALIDDKGVPPTLPEAIGLAGQVEDLERMEAAAVRVLQRALKAHPFADWCDRMPGVGAKQLGRLLSVVGDPYWHAAEDRPRKLYELYSYCGYGVWSGARHVADATHQRLASANGRGEGGSGRASLAGAALASVGQIKNGGHIRCDAHAPPAAGGRDAGDRDSRATHRDPGPGVAPYLARGRKANWSRDGRMRTYLIAQSAIRLRCAACQDAGAARKAGGDASWHPPAEGCTCAAEYPLRVIFDSGRVKYAESEHTLPCRRCGPKGAPADVGSPLNDGHKMARAMRLVAKNGVLRGIWCESRRLHLDAGLGPTSDPWAGGDA